MISCLCVTQPGRLSLLADAIGDFARQIFADRELVVLHDGDAAFDAAARSLADRHAGSVIRVIRVLPGQSLGRLRNQALDAASGDWVCQWDDDDRAHPLRLALQWNAAQEEAAAVSYLVDQLHWFSTEAMLYWDDWDREPYPMNLIQGTLLARRDIVPPYPDAARGEDTQQTHALLWAAATQGFRISRLRDVGWCSVYRHHGANAWDAAHHQAISLAKHLPAARLLPRLAELRTRFAEYQPGLPLVRMPVGTDLITLGER